MGGVQPQGKEASCYQKLEEAREEPPLEHQGKRGLTNTLI